MPLGLILDWGGVLTTPMQASFDAWIEAERIDRAAFLAVMRDMHDTDRSPLHEVERGNLTSRDFEQALACRLTRVDGGSVESAGLVARMMAEVRPNDPLRAIAKQARDEGWRVVILSNSWGQDYDTDSLTGFADSILLSHELGVRKPDPEAYAAALEATGLAPGACVMVDDLKRNVRGAEAAGLRGFHYFPGQEAQLSSAMQQMASGTSSTGV